MINHPLLENLFKVNNMKFLRQFKEYLQVLYYRIFLGPVFISVNIEDDMMFVMTMDNFPDIDDQEKTSDILLEMYQNPQQFRVYLIP